jgi:hypothetical protein
MDQQGFIEVATPTNDSEFIRVLTIHLLRAFLAGFMLFYFLGKGMFSDYWRKFQLYRQKKKGDAPVFGTIAEQVRFGFFMISVLLISFALISGFG